MPIELRKAAVPRARPLPSQLGFGQFFSDHMLWASYKNGAWQDVALKPFEDFRISPAACVLHYGQALFEGLKAYKSDKTGQPVLFRPEFNWQRMQTGAERLCMVAPPRELFLDGLAQLVLLDQDWIPKASEGSLYLRPTLIAQEPFLGVRPSKEFLFFVICSPVGSYYGSDKKGVKIWIEENYLRAGPGGLGATKAAANYAGSLKAAQEAKANGYDQVLWLDVEKKYVEEVGTMNVFFVFEEKVVTPILDGTILEGGTRAAVLQILRDWKITVEERKLSLGEIESGLTSGQLREAFGTGTAAVISPIQELGCARFQKQLPLVPNALASRLYDEILGMQTETKPDRHGWVYRPKAN